MAAAGLVAAAAMEDAVPVRPTLATYGAASAVSPACCSESLLIFGERWFGASHCTRRTRLESGST
jgi:hypothetical protein